MTSSGLSSNFYLIDNPIFLNISDISIDASYVELVATRLSPTGTDEINTRPQRIYVLSSSLSIDIAPLIKSLMPEPAHNTNYSDLTAIPFYGNSVKVRITLLEKTWVGTRGDGRRYIKTTDTLTSTKTFIRGGRRTYASNQNLVAGTFLLPTDIIPVWDGYPADYYYTSIISGIEKSNVIPENIRENRSVKGCEPLYVKFMNSLGGYSYWLFENWEVKESNRNLGSILRAGSVLDLGSDFETGITLISKVPQRFVPLLGDLILSKEIYLYDKSTQLWSRLSSRDNTIARNPYSVNTKVKLNFTPYHRLNSSMIW